MKTRLLISAALIGLTVVPAWAETVLDFPDNARASLTLGDDGTSFAVPTGSYVNDGVPTVQASGHVTRQVWTYAGNGSTTLDLLTPLLQQLEVSGFTILLNCETRGCGGFDFRFGADVLPEPDMHVDLGDYRYVSARRDRDGELPEFVTLMISRSADAGFVQVTTVGDRLQPPAQVTVSTKNPDATVVAAEEDLAASLAGHGSAVLEGIAFGSGSAALGADTPAVLGDLADYLKADASRSVVLVGHTDASGSLEANIALSKRRAQSVMQYLIDEDGVPASQLRAEGVGYLSPRASNETEEGRAMNRRVEAVLTPAN